MNFVVFKLCLFGTFFSCLPGFCHFAYLKNTFFPLGPRHFLSFNDNKIGVRRLKYSLNVVTQNPCWMLVNVVITIEFHPHQRHFIFNKYHGYNLTLQLIHVDLLEFNFSTKVIKYVSL